MKKSSLFLLLFLTAYSAAAQDLFNTLYFVNEEINIDPWFNWDMIKKNKVKTMSIYIKSGSDPLIKDTAYVIKRTYDITGKLTGIYWEDIVNRNNHSPDAHKHKAKIEYGNDGYIKKITTDFRESHKTSNPQIDWVDLEPSVMEYTYTKDSLGRIKEQLMTHNKQPGIRKKKVLLYDANNHITEIKEYYCANCGRDRSLLNGDEPIEDIYNEGERTLIMYNAEGKKSMAYYMNGPGSNDTLFSRYSYDAAKNSERKETFVKRYGIGDVLAEAYQSISSVTYDQTGIASEITDERNQACYKLIYDDKNKLIKAITCEGNAEAYKVVYTYYK
ncbi:MAG TPA: hypothetical protein VGC65_03390 [Bacteroidia bacterium]|jgi:hypothetical protein